MRTTTATTFTLALVALALAACASQPEAPAAPERTENADLGLAIAALPEAFEVAENLGESLKLAAPDVVGALSVAYTCQLSPTSGNANFCHTASV